VVYRSVLRFVLCAVRCGLRGLSGLMADGSAGALARCVHHEAQVLGVSGRRLRQAISDKTQNLPDSQ
jgi:hypothetical protein